jgi:zinc transport system substrate-binding protein
METKRLIIFGSIIAAVVMGMSFFSPTIKPKTVEKPIVSVSTYLLYEISHAVAGDTLDIHPIIPPGSDAHMFSPNPKQVAEISNAALFIYNGAGFETWAESLKNTLSKTTSVMDMSTYVSLLKEEAAGEHHRGAYDPHYWLDIDKMIKMTKTIDTALSKLSPANTTLYHRNAALYIAKLEKLKVDYAAGLKECKNRTLISNHDAFGYLAHANNLDNISVIGLSSDEQPSAKVIADIIALVKEHGIKTIFFEAFINDNVAQTIAQESGAQAESLQPLENISEDELKSHQTYESIMRDNLAKLTQAMECR